MAKTILVADDSVTIRKVVEWTFHETDIRVEMVASGREAIERMAALRPDVVLVDVMMPEPDGYEICRVIKASPHPVPVLLLAGTFEPFDAARAQACGADGHVVKPFESRALLRRVEELLATGGGAPFSGTSPARLHVELEAVLDEIALEPLPPAPALLGAAEADLAEVLLGPEPSVEAEPEAPRSESYEPPVPAFGSEPIREELSEEQIARIAKIVVAMLSDRIVREIAWEVVPDLAESIIRERLRQLERVDSDPA